MPPHPRRAIVTVKEVAAMKTILVCYEERPVAARVLDRAAEVALALGASVVLTSVAPTLAPAARGFGPYDPVDGPERHEEELDEAAARLAELGVPGAEKVVGTGDPARSILGLAEERKVDLIVLGAHDGGLWTRLLEGSTGDTVVHKAHTDVLVVR
jgi:universal stress protein A